MSWMDNHTDQAPARFVPDNSATPVAMWPKRAFRGDAGGGFGVDCLGAKHDVLARNAPDWATVVLSAAIEAGAPVMALKVGSAGKYRFWRLIGANPAEAQRHSAAAQANFDAAAASSKSAWVAREAARATAELAVVMAARARCRAAQVIAATEAGLVIVDDRPEYAGSHSIISLAMDEDGRVFEIRHGCGMCAAIQEIAS